MSSPERPPGVDERLPFQRLSPEQHPESHLVPSRECELDRPRASADAHCRLDDRTELPLSSGVVHPAFVDDRGFDDDRILGRTLDGVNFESDHPMARALEVPLEEFGELSLQSNNPIAINAQCAVFAESEVVSLVHRKTSKPDMARAIHDAIADRITSMVRRVGVEERIALIGGVARNVGFVRSLSEDLESELIIPEDMDYVGAIGAALVAADENGGQSNTEDA